MGALTLSLLPLLSFFLGWTPSHRPFPPCPSLSLLLWVILGHWCFSNASNKTRLLDRCIPQQSTLLRLIMSNIFLCPDSGGTHSARAGGAMKPLLSPSHTHTVGAGFHTFPACLSHFSLYVPQPAPGPGCLAPGLCFSFTISVSEILFEVSSWPQLASAGALSTVKSKHCY